MRPLAAEHQLLMASRNTSQVFGVSGSLCLASRHLPSDSGVKAVSAGKKHAKSSEVSQQSLTLNCW